MTVQVPAQIALAALNHGAQLDSDLCNSLRAAGAEIVYEASLQALDFAALSASGARVVVVNLAMQDAADRSGAAESEGDDAAVDEAIDQLHADGFDVVFNEVQDAANGDTEQRARWVRHLIAKVLRRPDFILPPQPQGAARIAAMVVPPLAAVAAFAVTEHQAEPAIESRHATDEAPTDSAAMPAATPQPATLPAEANHEIIDEVEFRADEDDLLATADSPTSVLSTPDDQVDAAPAMSWQDAQDALDFSLLDFDEQATVAAPVAEAPVDETPFLDPFADGSEADAPVPVAAELVDWDQTFKLVDMEPSERPTVELPVPEKFSAPSVAASVEPPAPADVAAEGKVDAPDWGLVPLADEQAVATSDDIFSARSMFIPAAADTKSAGSGPRAGASSSLSEPFKKDKTS